MKGEEDSAKDIFIKRHRYWYMMVHEVHSVTREVLKILSGKNLLLLNDTFVSLKVKVNVEIRTEKQIAYIYN